MSTTENDQEVTDVDEYIEENPEFADCRGEGHDFPKSRSVPLVEAYNDSEATHQRVLMCPICKSTKRERYQITIRRRKVVGFVQLETRSGYVKGYVAKGVRIPRRYVKEVSIRRRLEAELASEAELRKVPEQARGGAASTRTRTAARGSRKARVA